MTKRRLFNFLEGLIYLNILLFSPFMVFPQSAPFKLRVTEELANIRQKPDIRSPVLLQVPQNTVLEALRREGEWYLVRWSDEEGSTKTGFIHESLVAVIELENVPPEKAAVAATLPPEKKPAAIPPGQTPPRQKTLLPSGKARGIFQLNLAPGLEILSLTEINEATAGLAGLIGDLVGNNEASKVSSLHWSPAASLEMGLRLRSNFSLLLGLSGVSASKQNSVAFTSTPGNPSLRVESRIRAIPTSLLLSYEFLPFLSLALGPEVTPIEYRYFYRLIRENYQEEWEGKATAFGFGLRGKIVFSTSLTPALRVFLEVGGRLEKISGFEGKDTHRLPSGETSIEEGKLYSFQVKTYADRSYPLLFIRSKRPLEAGVWDVREATLNFHGATLRLGLNIWF